MAGAVLLRHTHGAKLAHSAQQLANGDLADELAVLDHRPPALVLPQHILIQENEHGARLVGYTCTGPIGEPLSVTAKDYSECYPKWFKKGSRLSEQADLVMSARSIISALGGDASKGFLPKEVPDLLAKVILRVAKARENEAIATNAWALREELGQVADQIYGDSVFIPIEMPE